MSKPPVIGIFGGHTVYELGPPADVEAFFQAVTTAMTRWPDDAPGSLLLDRLYRRYLHAEALPAARQAMAAVQARFARLVTDDPAFRAAREASADPASRLPAQAPTGAALFGLWFTRFDEAVDAALSFQAEFGIYQAVRLVIADMPGFMIDKKRPLPQYDALEGPPFWQRSTAP